MTVTLNNELVTLTDTHVSISELMQERNIPLEGSAVAVNGRLVPRTKRDTTYLQDKDDIVIISAAFGG